MERLRILRDWIARLLAQRWSREILMAVLLTIAAIAFIATAFVSGGDRSGQHYETATKPPHQQ